MKTNKENLVKRYQQSVKHQYLLPVQYCRQLLLTISPDKARKGVIYPLKTGIYALVGISEKTFTR